MVKTEIRIGAEVLATDGPCGSTVCIVLDPIEKRVTHLVVQERQASSTLRLVPMAAVQRMQSGEILLSATTQQFKEMELFLDERLLPSHQRIAFAMLWPYVDPASALDLEHVHVPAGKIAVLRETPVRATDGSIGSLDELLIDHKDGKITDLVLREGRVWAQKDIVVPVAQVRKIRQDAIDLRLSKREVQGLPEIQAH